MSLFKNETPVLGQGTTLVEVGAGSTSSTTQLSNAYKPCTRELVDVTMQAAAQHVTQWVYQAPFACQVVAVRENHTVASSAGTLDVVKIVSDGVAPAAANGTTIKTLLASVISTSGTANTRQNKALAASGSPWILAQGDQLAVVNGAGATTGYVGSVQIEVVQLS